MFTRKLQRIHTVIGFCNDFVAMTFHQHTYSKTNDG
jgi:hypothetical protein